MELKYRLLTVLTLAGLLLLGYFGSRQPFPISQPADAMDLPPLTSTATATVSPTTTPSPTATPTPTPTPTATFTPMPSPTPTITPTPTPDMTVLDAHWDTDAALPELLCQPDQEVSLREGEVLVPILLYHFVGRGTMEADGQSQSRFNVTVADFDAQLAILHRLGYQTVTVGEIAAAISGTYALPPRPIAITIDDGWIEQYSVMFPLLQKYGMRATFYIPSNYPVGGRFVTWEQLQEMVDAGMEIGSHTRTHADLTAVDLEIASYELTASKRVLEEKLGITVLSVSYPFGNYSGAVIELARNAGYQAAVAVGPPSRQSVANLFALRRIEIIGTEPLLKFVSWLPWRGQGTELCPAPPAEVLPPPNVE